MPTTKRPKTLHHSRPPLVDIIVATYENEQLTIDCFKSIKANTTPGDYRVIWVDNGSKAYRRAKTVLRDVNHLFIRLGENKGFVGAINEGLKVSDGRMVCLLNNDTEVTPRWLDKLCWTLHSDPRLGIVGPLTGPPAEKMRWDSHHNIDYQQRYSEMLRFPKFVDFVQFNREIENCFSGRTARVDFVAFLCALIKREVIDKVGPLDENFVMGMWDDADYNELAKKAGYKVALALDTCIYHRGRSTFDLLQQTQGLDIEGLLKKNWEYLQRKRAIR